MPKVHGCKHFTLPFRNLTSGMNPTFTITNAITRDLTKIERARGFLDAATLSDEWVRRMSQRALLLASTEGSADPLDDLSAAADELQQAALDPVGRLQLRIEILTAALAHVRDNGAAPQLAIAGARATVPALRSGLEQAYRDAARLADDPVVRTRLVDQANAVRVRSLT